MDKSSFDTAPVPLKVELSITINTHKNMTVNIYGKPQRTFHGNQYVGRTWRMTKTILSGTWIGIKEIVHNPGKVALAMLVLGSFAAFTISAQPHLLSIKSAWADLTTDEEVKYVREVVETSVDEDPVIILEKIARCESGGKQFYANGTLVKRINTDGSIDPASTKLTTKGTNTSPPNLE